MLGQKNSFTGIGNNKVAETGGTYKMTMTGVGGASLLGKCEGQHLH